MLISCVYWLFRHLLGLEVLRCRSVAANEVELDGRVGCTQQTSSAAGAAEPVGLGNSDVHLVPLQGGPVVVNDQVTSDASALPARSLMRGSVVPPLSVAVYVAPYASALAGVSVAVCEPES